MGEFKNTRKTHHITFDDADMNQQNLSKMTNDRNIIQLLELIKSEIKRKTFFWKMCHSICNLVYALHSNGDINISEKSKLIHFMSMNKPQEIYIENDIEYFFKPGLAKPRIEWLNEQIQRLQKEQQAL